MLIPESDIIFFWAWQSLTRADMEAINIVLIFFSSLFLPLFLPLVRVELFWKKWVKGWGMGRGLAGGIGVGCTSWQCHIETSAPTPCPGPASTAPRSTCTPPPAPLPEKSSLDSTLSQKSQGNYFMPPCLNCSQDGLSISDSLSRLSSYLNTGHRDSSHMTLGRGAQSLDICITSKWFNCLGCMKKKKRFMTINRGWSLRETVLSYCQTEE